MNKNFAVYCPTPEIWDRLLSVIDNKHPTKIESDDWRYYKEKSCMSCHVSNKYWYYAAKEFYDTDADTDCIISLDYYLKHIKPFEKEIIVANNKTSVGMDGKQLDLFNKNIKMFVKSFECVGGSPTYLLEQHMSFLETAARNGLELQFILHTCVGR